MDLQKKIYSYEELQEILKLHRMWLLNEEGGKRAVLSGADLSGADLRRAVLSDADLSGAVLSGAVLSGADLRRADLRRADLRRADLSGADLSGADLSDADLRRADLSGIKNDVIVSILRLPNEIPFLRQTLLDGKIDGSVYQGECACLAGTMAKACNQPFDQFKLSNRMDSDSSSLRERWFLGISTGDTPEKHAISKITLEWIDEAQALVDAIRGKFAA